MHADLKLIYAELKIGEAHLSACRLSPCTQAPLNDLEITEIDFEGKPFILAREAAAAWRRMRSAAQSDGVTLQPFSGFRSYFHQKRLISKKLENGKPLERILTETAIPGFSEHHSGRAVDICTNDDFQLSEAFEKTDAFTWLLKNAERFKFDLSYPRTNEKGIVYEPWHWCFRL